MASAEAPSSDTMAVAMSTKALAQDSLPVHAAEPESGSWSALTEDSGFGSQNTAVEEAAQATGNEHSQAQEEGALPAVVTGPLASANAVSHYQLDKSGYPLDGSDSDRYLVEGDVNAAPVEGSPVAPCSPPQLPREFQQQPLGGSVLGANQQVRAFQGNLALFYI